MNSPSKPPPPDPKEEEERKRNRPAMATWVCNRSTGTGEIGFIAMASEPDWLKRGELQVQ